MPVTRFERHRRGKRELAEIFANAKNVSAIHYSCESFYDRGERGSPRITSIAVRDLDSGQTASFSIHQKAELGGISLVRNEIEARYNQLERAMLEDFFSYLKRNSSRKFMHWNMRDENYGFQAIEHRLRVLGGEPFSITNDRKFDLSRNLIDIYGVNYIDHPRLENIMNFNLIKGKDFLNGAEEAKAFDEGRYFDLHRSTLTKIDVFCNISQRAVEGKLRVKSKWRDQVGFSPDAIVEKIRKHPVYAFITMLVALGSAWMAIIRLWKWVMG